YDLGRVKQKLVKNTSENTRSQEITGRTPANLLLFGAPEKLLDGGKTEEIFDELLETGYGRRCLFGFSARHARIGQTLTPEELYQARTSGASLQTQKQLASQLERLANVINTDKVIAMDKEVALTWMEYQLLCESRADDLPDHAGLLKTEMMHRHFKALKLAGAYAFVDDSPEITREHLFMALKLVEESGKAYRAMLNRERPYVKLARYIASIGRPVTQADLVEDLPFYKGTASQKQEMMTLAISHGYQNNIIIKKSFEDGIEFLRGESLEETDLNKLILSHSTDLAYNYQNEEAPFDKLHVLTQAAGRHWVTHHLSDGHRQDDSAVPGFNMIVLDIDGTVPLPVAMDLLKDYKALYYTTKSHTESSHRFRIVLPISHVLKLDGDEFKELMRGIFEWLPFEVDDVTGQRVRKWASHNGQHFYNDGKLLDILPFIPKTSKNEQRKAQLKTQEQMDNLERWVINNTGDGNRNNQLMRYAFILVDAGFSEEVIRSRVTDLNDKLADKLKPEEIMGTIMVSVAKRVLKRDSQ
ncbi:MAG: primase C-terminal domain-containing protein, partial [Pseudomonadota bacterium]